MTKRNLNLFESGLNFRRAVLEKGILPEQFKSLLRDVCSEHDELMPALLDLTTRRLFKDLPFTGTPSQQTLARDSLLSEVQPLYRDGIVSEIMEFVEGALGYVDDPSVNEEVIKKVADIGSRGYPQTIPEESQPREAARGYDEHYSGQDNNYPAPPQSLYGMPSRRHSFNSMTQSINNLNRNLSLPAQVARVLLYQAPVISIYILFTIISSAQADSVHFMSNLRPSEMLHDYSYGGNSYWFLISMVSITFWASVVHFQQHNAKPLRLEYSILICYVFIFFIPLLPFVYQFQDFLFLGISLLIRSAVSIIIARIAVALLKPTRW